MVLIFLKTFRSLFKLINFTSVELKQQVDSLPLHKLNDCPLGVVERSLLMSAFLGMVEDMRFWTVVSFYLQAAAIKENE